MAVTLTYQDIRAIAVNFDQTQGVIPPTVQDYAAINFIHEHEQTAGDVNKYVVEAYLPSNPSVTAMLDFYKGSPETKEKPVLRNLNSASKAILIKFQIPRESNEECFKQVFEIIFQDYFARLTSKEKLEIARKWEVLPPVVTQLEHITSILDLKQKITELRGQLAQLQIGLNETDAEKVSLQVLQFWQYSDLMRDVSLEAYSKRLSLTQNLNNAWIYGAFAAISMLMGILRSNRSGGLGIGITSFVALLVGLLFYETIFRRLSAGAAIYVCRSRLYCHFKSQAEGIIHQRINQFIATHQERINQTSTPALVKKWRDRAVEIVVLSVSISK